MSTKYSGKIIRKILLFLILCFCISGYARGIENRRPVPTIQGTQKNSLSAFDMEFIISSAHPDRVKPLNEATTNGMRLDSIYEDKNFGLKTDKRKWIYHYDNNRLILLEHLFFSTTYDTQMDIREAWYYNTDGQVSRYEERDKFVPKVDSLFITLLEENLYENERLIFKHTKQKMGMSAGEWLINGELVIEYEIRYEEDSIHYQYNEKNLLIKEYVEGNSDTTYYRYDSQDRLKMKIEKYFETNSMHIETHEYHETDSTKFNIEKGIYIYGATDDAVIDTISTWQYEYSYDYTLDEQDRVSVLIFSYYRSGNEYYKTFYNYSPTGQIEYISIYFWDATTTEDGAWYEQARIEYTYDELGNILVYHRTFYDDRVHSWETEELKTYYYSSTKSLTTDKEMLSKEFHIYPNPATDFINLSMKQNVDTKYTIYNMFGEKVSEGVVDNHSILVSVLKSGTYFVRIYNDTTNLFCRFLKY